MEELRSTEALDREILEDARKKADRILKNSETAKKLVIETWHKKKKDDIAALEKKSNKRIAAQRSEILARLPLDKRRSRAERYDSLLREAMDAYLASLPRSSLFQVLERELLLRVSSLPSKDIRVYANEFSQNELDSLLASCMGKRSWKLEKCIEGSGFPELLLEADKVNVRIGIAEIAQALLSDYRSELAVALLGEDAAND